MYCITIRGGLDSWDRSAWMTWRWHQLSPHPKPPGPLTFTTKYSDPFGGQATKCHVILVLQLGDYLNPNEKKTLIPNKYSNTKSQLLEIISTQTNQKTLIDPPPKKKKNTHKLSFSNSGALFPFKASCAALAFSSASDTWPGIFFPSGVRLSEQRKKSGMFGFMANQPNPPNVPPWERNSQFSALWRETNG